jgi:hypothetical protein
MCPDRKWQAPRFPGDLAELTVSSNMLLRMVGYQMLLKALTIFEMSVLLPLMTLWYSL